jgi:hypothetical protein
MATELGRAKAGRTIETEVFSGPRNNFHDNVVMRFSFSYKDFSPSGRFLLCDFRPSSSPEKAAFLLRVRLAFACRAGFCATRG